MSSEVQVKIDEHDRRLSAENTKPSWLPSKWLAVLCAVLAWFPSRIAADILFVFLIYGPMAYFHKGVRVLSHHRHDLMMSNGEVLTGWREVLWKIVDLPVWFLFFFLLAAAVQWFVRRLRAKRVGEGG